MLTSIGPCLKERTAIIQSHFEGAIGMDDFLFRAETLLYSHDFTGKANASSTAP